MYSQFLKSLIILSGVIAVVGCSSTPELDKNFSSSVRSAVERQRINAGPSGNPTTSVDAIEVRSAYNNHVNSRPSPASITPVMGTSGAGQ